MQCTGFLYKVYYTTIRRPHADLESGTCRILCVGESTTFGYPVHGRGYPEQPESILHKNFPDRKFKVYNLGVCAITSREIVRHFQRNIIDYRPHLIIVLAGQNRDDISTLCPHQEEGFLNKVRVLIIDQVLRLKTCVVSYEILKGMLNRKIHVYRIYSDIYVNYDHSDSARIGDEEERSNLDYMVRAAARNHSKVLICNYFSAIIKYGLLNGQCN